MARTPFDVFLHVFLGSARCLSCASASGRPRPPECHSRSSGDRNMANIFTQLVRYPLLLEMTFVLGLGGVCQIGFHRSVLNSVTPYVQKFINETWLDRNNASISHSSLMLIWSSTVSIISIGGIVGNLASLYLVEKYGKKGCLMWNNLVLVGASLIMGCSKIGGSYEMLLIGRLLFGFNEGLGQNLNSQYVGEIAPKKLRGFTSTSLSLFFSIGLVFGQILGLSEIFGTESLWPLLVSISGITSLIQLVRIPFYPETPPYLLFEKGDMDACRKAAERLWDKADVQGDIDDLMKEYKIQKMVKPLSILQLLQDRSSRWQLYLSGALAFGLAFCGVNSIFYYSYSIFEDAGFSTKQINYISVGIGLCQFISVLLSSLVVDSFGGKRLLLIGYGVMALVLGLLTVTLSLQDSYPWTTYCSVILVFVFVFSHGIGPGAMTLAMRISVFTQSSRPAALVILGISGWSWLFLVGIIFPYILEGLGQYCFVIFIALIVALLAVFYKFLPEMKGLSTMEISNEFNKLNFRKSKHGLLDGECIMRQSSDTFLVLHDFMEEALQDAKAITEIQEKS